MAIELRRRLEEEGKSPLFAWELALKPQAWSQEKHFYLFRYGFEFPLLAAILGASWGNWIAERKGILDSKPLRRQLLFQRARLFTVPTVAYCGAVIAIWALTPSGWDNAPTRAVCGALAAAAVGSKAAQSGKWPRAGWKMLPWFSGLSVVWRYMERPEPLTDRFNAYIDYERRRIRAQILIDPDTTPNYEELRDALEEGIR